MYYCFLQQDMIRCMETDPLVIQKEYASRLQKAYTADLQCNTILKNDKTLKNLNGEKILLRCSYDNLRQGIGFLDGKGANLVETLPDIEKVENWYGLKLTRRDIRCAKWTHVREGAFDEYLTDLLQCRKFVFLKSKGKGFSAKINPNRLLKRKPSVIAFLNEKCMEYGEELLLTEYLDIKSDSLGLRESRHFIFNGEVKNSSRFVKSIRHIVPRSHIKRAEEFADHIAEIKEFPPNYVMDLAEFISDEGVYVDIEELNPISCSMCYANNSVFEEESMDALGKKKELQMGIEFCYDATKHPDAYFTERTTNQSYTYISNFKYCFE